MMHFISEANSRIPSEYILFIFLKGEAPIPKEVRLVIFYACVCGTSLQLCPTLCDAMARRP